MSDISFEAENVARYTPSHAKVRGQIAVDGTNMEYHEQMAEYPIAPILDRPHPVLDYIKARAPIIPRVKLLGAFGVIDPEEDVRGQRFGAGGYGGRYSVERRIPEPYPYTKFRWPAEKEISRLPSVQAGAITTGPERTVSPQKKVRASKISIHPM